MLGKRMGVLLSTQEGLLSSRTTSTHQPASHCCPGQKSPNDYQVGGPRGRSVECILPSLAISSTHSISLALSPSRSPSLSLSPSFSHSLTIYSVALILPLTPCLSHTSSSHVHANQCTNDMQLNRTHRLPCCWILASGLHTHGREHIHVCIDMKAAHECIDTYSSRCE